MVIVNENLKKVKAYSHKKVVKIGFLYNLFTYLVYSYDIIYVKHPYRKAFVCLQAPLKTSLLSL